MKKVIVSFVMLSFVVIAILSGTKLWNWRLQNQVQESVDVLLARIAIQYGNEVYTLKGYTQNPNLSLLGLIKLNKSKEIAFGVDIELYGGEQTGNNMPEFVTDFYFIKEGNKFEHIIYRYRYKDLLYEIFLNSTDSLGRKYNDNRPFQVSVNYNNIVFDNNMFPLTSGILYFKRTGIGIEYSCYIPVVTNDPSFVLNIERKGSQ